MDYQAWGEEYLQQAEKLRAIIWQRRERLKVLHGEEVLRAYRELRILTQMYTDCLQTGHCLQAKETGRSPTPRIAKDLRMIYNKADNTHGGTERSGRPNGGRRASKEVNGVV